MSADRTFRARCWAAELVVKKCSITELWSMSLHRFAGKARKYRCIVFVCGSRGDPFVRQEADVPHIGLDDEENPQLWLRGACIEFPESILPGLQAFLAEHVPSPATTPAAAEGGAV
jgi:hypothetical protein